MILTKEYLSQSLRKPEEYYETLCLDNPDPDSNVANIEKIDKDAFNKFISLEILTISNSQIKEIEGLDKLTNLKVLNISGNQIEKIEGLDKLTNLEELIISYNKIKKIEGLDKLTNLLILDISGNQIEKIEGLDKLTKLQDLYISNNQIENIEDLGYLANLKELYIYNNQIEQIIDLRRFPKLRILDIINNPLTQYEINIVRKLNPGLIFRYTKPKRTVKLTKTLTHNFKIDKDEKCMLCLENKGELYLADHECKNIFCKECLFDIDFKRECVCNCDQKKKAFEKGFFVYI